MAVAWALYELSEHPDMQTRLRTEIHSVLGKSYNPETPPTFDQLEQMSYLNNVCREVLRIDPPGSSPPRISLLTFSPRYGTASH
jgi:cytochrome P450